MTRTQQRELRKSLLRIKADHYRLQIIERTQQLTTPTRLFSMGGGILGRVLAPQTWPLLLSALGNGRLARLAKWTGIVATVYKLYDSASGQSRGKR